MRRLILMSAVVCTALGCAPQAGPSARAPGAEAPAKNPNAARIIVKFRESSAAASRPEFIEQLARSAGVALVYVRPLSGGAHLYAAHGVDDPNDVARAIERLSKRPDVEYVEPDRVMRIK